MSNFKMQNVLKIMKIGPDLVFFWL